MSAADLDIGRGEPLGMHEGADITLSPSKRGMGPNTYLGANHFWAMVAAAFVLHVTLLTVYAIWPKQKVTNIPVRALTFKLGGTDRIAAYGAPTAVGTSIPTAQQAKPVIAAPSMQVREWKPPVVQKIVERQRPTENTIAPVPHFQPTPVPVMPKPQPVVAPQPMPVAKPAIAPDPQRYIREVGAAPAGPTPQQGNLGNGIATGAIGGKGTENIMTPQTAEAVRARYEQEISGWVERHKIYPPEAGKAAGRVTMRVRIDRQGYVRYYAIETSSGNTILDRAAIEMIRRANPVPAAPANYPAGDLIEFLIPISFEAP